MIDSVNALVTQGMICFRGPSQFWVVKLPSSRDVRGMDRRQDLLEDLERSNRATPFVASAEQILGGDHIEDRADVLRHPAVNEHQALRECFGERIGLERRRPIRGRGACSRGCGPAAGGPG